MDYHFSIDSKEKIKSSHCFKQFIVLFYDYQYNYGTVEFKSMHNN